MEIKKGLVFTGKWFTGRIEVHEVDEMTDRVRVGLTVKHETHSSNWNEDWILSHVKTGFENGDYFLHKNFK